MGRLFVNLALIGFIVFVSWYFIYPYAVCIGTNGSWNIKEQKCEMGTYELPWLPKENTFKPLDIGSLSSLSLSVPDVESSVVVERTVDRKNELSGEFTIPGATTVGSVDLSLSRATFDKNEQLALIPYSVNYGGTGSFVYVGLFERVGDTLVHRDSRLVGDRVGVTGVRFAADAFALVSFLDRKVDEAMAALPTIPKELRVSIAGALFTGDSEIENSSLVTRQYKDVLRVTANLSVPLSTPLTLMGEARGTWFFEGSFPVSVVDWDGKIIGEGVAQADGEWMTENYVPFTATVSYVLPKDTPYKRGAIILKKDNPSGLPEHDDAFEVAVTFK